MEKFEGVANTTYVPLVARIYVSKRFPEYFYDEKALELEPYLPAGADKGSMEYTNMASSARYYNFDQMIAKYRAAHDECNIVNLGAGLDTSFSRLTKNTGVGNTHFYAVDLPEVAAARKQVLGDNPDETLIAGDMFTLDWAKQVDAHLPTLMVVSGVFQYFHEADILAFIAALKNAFPQGELIFDATSEVGLKYTNWFIKRTGNKSALMYFAVNDSAKFAEKTGTKLLEERPFFTDARNMLKKKLGLISRVSMRVADNDKRTIILHLQLN